MYVLYKKKVCLYTQGRLHLSWYMFSST